MTRILLLAVVVTASGCTPAKVVGNAVIDTGQVVLGAADALI